MMTAGKKSAFVQRNRRERGMNIAAFIVLILLIGGLQMITLGIIGEYIARIYIQGKHRPLYIAKEYLHSEEEA